MATSTAIEWTETTWNPLAGCSEVSPGCTNCYAAVMAKRLEAMGQTKYAGTTRQAPSGKTVWTGKINLVPSALGEPLAWRKPKRVFVNSMSDLFHEGVPDAFIRKVFAIMSLAGQHTFQVLTKRAARMARWFADPENTLSACQAELIAGNDDFGDETPTGKSRVRNTRAINGTSGKRAGDGNYWPLPNVWLGVSVEDQKRADERIPHLLRTPAAVRWLSCEPLLGPVDLLQDETVTYCNACGQYRPEAGGDCEACGDPRTRERCYLDALDWIVVGGESGPGARPCDIEWIRALADQCRAVSVPVFVKQLGSAPFMGVKGFGPIIQDRKGGDMDEFPEDLRVRQWPEVSDGR